MAESSLTNSQLQDLHRSSHLSSLPSSHPSLSLCCVHCGTEFWGNASQRFCCSGCEFVFNLIESKGLTHFYELKNLNPPVCPLPVQNLSKITTSTFDYCDDPEFIKKSTSANGRTLNFYLEGMNCTACLWLLEKLPDFCPDAELARVNLTTSTIEVTRITEGSFARIAQTLNRFGYRPHPLRENVGSQELRQLQTQERRRDLVRIGMAGVLTGNIMILAVSLYGGAAGELAQQFRWLSAVLASPVLTYCAWPFYKSAFSALRAKHLNLDVPIVVALVAGVVTSLWALSGTGPEVYFDSLSMLVFLLLSSRFILKAIQTRHLQATHLEDELLLSTVKRVLKSTESLETISSTQLKSGDLIRIESSCDIPVDGVVESGWGLIDTAVLTGESEIKELRPGDQVEAGSRNHFQPGAAWDLRVENPPAQTRLAQILRDTENSARDKSEFVSFTNTISQWFIGLVFLGALILCVIFANDHFSEGLSRALALMIVTCPCVFGIAIPLSMSFAIRAAARKGIVIKNANAIEKLWTAKDLFFDKTGTLTCGEMSVLSVKTNAATDAKSENPQSLGIAYGLELNQIHPVAQALNQHFRQLHVQPEALSEVTRLAKGGVSGRYRGQTYTLRPLDGSKNSVTSSKHLVAAYGLFLETDDTTQMLVEFELSDQVRPDARELLQWARSQKFNVNLISGDKNRVVEACAQNLGLAQSQIFSEVTPEQKAEQLRLLEKSSVMIGDGINDAAALASASVGIAVCGSLDVSLRAADVYLLRPRLMAIQDLFSIARQTKRAILRNLVFSASFNVISGVLAAAGLMSPLWAAVLMPLSSLLILLSAFWTGRHL